MKKKIAKNVVLIMSGGSGQRFGADKPKQYCLMGGRPIIEYAIDVCRHAAKCTDMCPTKVRPSSDTEML